MVDDLRVRFAADTDVVEVEAYLSSQGYDRRQIGEIVLNPPARLAYSLRGKD